MALPPGVVPLTPELERAAVNYVDESAGAPFMTRWAAGKQFNKEGVGRYLAAKLGQGNVLPVLSSLGEVENFVIREAPDKQWMTFDPQAKGVISFLRDLPGDIADVSGDLVESGAQTLGAIGGGLIGSAAGGVGAIPGAIMGAGGAGVLANAERQAEVSALPGAIQVSATERAGQAIQAGNVAALSELGGQLIGSAAKGVTKQVRRAIQPKYRNALSTFEERLPVGREEALAGTGKTAAEVTKEGMALEGRLAERGVPVTMSSAQLSGSRKTAGFENIIRTSSETMNAAGAIDKDVALQFGRGMDKLINQVSKGEVGAAKATDMLAGSYNEMRSRLYKAMESEDAVNFGRIAMATKGGPLFSAKPLLDFVDKAAPQLEGLGKNTASAEAKYMRGVVDDVLTASGLSWAKVKSGQAVITAKQMQSALRVIGKRSADGEVVDMPVRIGGQKASVQLGRSQTKSINKGLFKALQGSLDEALAKIGDDPASSEARSVAESIRQARAAHLASIEAIEKTESAFGEMAIDLADKNMASLGPGRYLARSTEELASISSMLRKTPEGAQTADKMAGAAIREIVEKSLTAESKGEVVSMAKLSTALFNNRKKLEAIVGSDDKAFLGDITELAHRLRRVPVFGGNSQTAFVTDELPKIPGKSGLVGSGMNIANEVARKVGILQSPKSMLRALNDREQIKLMLKLVGPRAYDRPIVETSRLLTKLLGIQASKLGRDDEELQQRIIGALNDDPIDDAKAQDRVTKQVSQ